MKERRKVDSHQTQHFRWIEKMLAAVLFILMHRAGEKKRRLNLNIREFHGKQRGTKMALPPVVLKDSEKVLISVSPQLASGEADTAVDVAFASSDPSVGIEEQADGRSAYILTPGERGTAQITVTAPGYADETLDVSYEPGTPRSLNLSVGNPVSDLDAPAANRNPDV